MSKGMLKLVVNKDATGVIDSVAAPAEEITKATIDRLAKRPASGRDEYIQDSEVPGFKLRRTRQGTIVFFFHGRVRGGEGATKGKPVKRTIGRAKGKGAISVAKARAEAVALRDALAKGIDPAEELRVKAAAAEAAQREREQQAAVREWTPAYALAHMLEWRASRPDPALHFRPETIEFYQRGIGYLGKLAGVPIVDIRPDDIRRALDSIDGKAKPNKAKGALSGVINHAIKRLDLNIPNPVSRLDRGEYKARPPRGSYIKEGDLAEFIEKVDAIDIPGRPRESQRARDYMMLTLLYGTRKEELMRMRWDWVDWDEGIVTIPATLTKQKRAHYLPLTGWTRAILEARHDSNKRGSAYVFPSDRFGQLDPLTRQPIDQPMTNIRRSLARAVGSDFKLHDARRTLITHCASLGIHGPRAKAIVGHARQGVTESYDQREIEQVRRDLSTYHEWLHRLCETRRFEQFAAEHPEDWPELKAADEPPRQWPGTAPKPR
jgi:integrase